MLSATTLMKIISNFINTSIIDITKTRLNIANMTNINRISD